MRARVLRGNDRPVRDDRRIRLEKRHDKRVDVRRSLTARLEDDDVGQSRCVTHANLGIESSRALGGLGLDDDDHAAGVLARDRVGDLDRVVDVDEVGHADEQREDTAQSGRTALVAQLHNAGGDLGRRGVLQGDDHGSLQKRPSRASMSCADWGPQVPGA